MDFTFAIITGGNADIQTIVDSIRNQGIPNYEIIIVGKTSVKGEDITTIPFDETIKNIWHTKKKNLVVRFAKYENVVLTYDYMRFEKGWYEGFLRFGNTFKVCVNKMIDIEGRRFRDHVLFNQFLDARFSNTLIPYGVKLTPAVSKLLYISGGYCVIKKEIGLKYPLREELHWGHGEDVIQSHTLSTAGILLECNPFSTVTLIKEKFFWEREMSLEVYEELCKYAETGDLFERQKAFQINWHLEEFGIDLR
jgi:hypothetical protein